MSESFSERLDAALKLHAPHIQPLVFENGFAIALLYFFMVLALRHVVGAFFAFTVPLLAVAAFSYHTYVKKSDPSRQIPTERYVPTEGVDAPSSEGSTDVTDASSEQVSVVTESKAVVDASGSGSDHLSTGTEGSNHSGEGSTAAEADAEAADSRSDPVSSDDDREGCVTTSDNESVATGAAVESRDGVEDESSSSSELSESLVYGADGTVVGADGKGGDGDASSGDDLEEIEPGAPAPAEASGPKRRSRRAD